jgi:hypothetical protein
MTRHLTIVVTLGGLLLLGWWWLGTSKSASITVNASSSTRPVATGGSNSLSALRDPATVAAASATKLPQELVRDHLEPATRDPFAYLAAPVPPAPKQPPPMPVTILPTPIIMAAPAPSAPQHNLRFIGRMTTPDGQQLIFVTLAEAPITLTEGQNLTNGYRVDSITDRAVQLTYVALGTRARLDLPEPPGYETR